MTCVVCGRPAEVSRPDGHGEQVHYCGEHEPADDEGEDMGVNKVMEEAVRGLARLDEVRARCEKAGLDRDMVNALLVGWLAGAPVDDAIWQEALDNALRLAGEGKS